MIQQDKMLARVSVHRLQHGHKTLTNPMAQMVPDFNDSDETMEVFAKFAESLVTAV